MGIYGKNIETMGITEKNSIIIISAEMSKIETSDPPCCFDRKSPRKNKPSDQKDAQRGVI